MRKARDYREFMQYVADNFNDKLVMLILEKLELLRKDPLKYAREKLGKDKYNNPMFSIEVTGRFRTPLQIVISLLIWTYSMKELLNIFDHFTKK